MQGSGEEAAGRGPTVLQSPDVCGKEGGMKRVLVTGATGNVGRHVVSQLLGSNCLVRALTRNLEAANVPPGVEAVRGDLTGGAALDACLEGVDAVFLVWTTPMDAAADAIGRIARHARRIVLLTSPHKTAH